jgi:tRNA A-37 threonylcarbamoyl transferase component Bud32
MAYGKRRVWGFLETAFLITEAESDSVSFDAFVRDRSNGPVDPQERHALVRCLAQQVKNMHAKKISHGGLVWQNILVRPNKINRRGFVFHFLDPAPVRIKVPRARILIQA